MKDYDINQIFNELEINLIESMKRTLWSHKEDEKLKGFDWPQWQSLKIKEFENFKQNNKNILNESTKGLNGYIQNQIKKQFKEGASKTNKKAIQAGWIKREEAQLGGSFFGLNTKKLKSLVKSTTDDINDVKFATLRMANDQYRKIIYKAQIYASSEAGTVKQAIDMATKDFLSQGFNCIEYKNGTRHDITDYCDMSIRTATKRANLMGEGEMRKKIGNTLVYVSEHGSSCDLCGQWEGRVYIDDVWSGGTSEDGNYPLLSDAIAGGLFHPRCRHGTSTYFEGINDEPEKVTKSNKDEKEQYTQYLKRKQKQYERLATGSLFQENIEKYQNKANELQNQIESSKIELSDNEQYALNQYISSESYKINEMLMNNKILNPRQQEMVNNLDAALNRFKNYDGIVTRSIMIDTNELENFLKEHQEGNKIEYKAYTSATVGSRYNEKSNIELYIKSKNGKDIRQFNKDEQEILFKRNSKFRVIKIKKLNNTYNILMEEKDE